MTFFLLLLSLSCVNALVAPISLRQRTVLLRVQESPAEEEVAEKIPETQPRQIELDENPDQPDIVKKFVKQRSDWWEEGSFASPLTRRSDETGPIQQLAEIPLPAYFWLLLSTVLSIAFVGCIFELGFNQPPAPVLGLPATVAILLTSGPSFIALFLVAIARGQKEADDEDARFM